MPSLPASRCVPTTQDLFSKPRPPSRAIGRKAKTGLACTVPCWSLKQPAGWSRRAINRAHAAPRVTAEPGSAPPAHQPKTPPPGCARSPAQATPSRRHNVPAGARACTLIPRLPAPAATLAACCCRATGVSVPPETPFALRAFWQLLRQAEGDAPGPRTGVPWAKQPLACWLAAAVTPWSPAATEESGLPPREQRRPALQSSPCGERPTLTRLLSDLLISGGFGVSECLHSTPQELQYFCWPIEDHPSPGLL